MDTVRRAGFADLDPRTAYLLWQLRSQIFVVEQECAYLDLDGRDLEDDALHLWIESDGVPTAYLRVLHDAGTLRVGRVVVDHRHRGRGLAARLIEEALTIIGDRPSVLDAQAHLEHWYARFGYRRVGDDFLEDGIPHVRMVRPASPTS